MSKTFNRIGIVGRDRNHGINQTLHALCHHLKQQNKELLMLPDTHAMLPKPALAQAVEKTAFSELCDCIIAVGGDGNMLSAAHLAMASCTPVVGVNRGRLGFLTDIKPDEFDKLDAVLAGDYIEEQRTVLSCEIDQTDTTFALNEAVLQPSLVPHMLQFQIYIDGEFMCNERADGLIIATPTGSTAYALSGGGPILHPKLDAFVIVPMFPHTLSNRPIVIDGNAKITVKIDESVSTPPRVSCDGMPHKTVAPGQQIQIAKANTCLRLIHPRDYNYYETLRTKLHWGSKT